MPAIIPAIAGFGASLFGFSALGSSFAILGSPLLAGVVTGAVVGSIVGGLQSAITGGDISDGLLYGAIGGAVGGTLGGAFAATEFGASFLGIGAPASETAIVSGEGIAVTAPGAGYGGIGVKTAVGEAASEGLLFGLSGTELALMGAPAALGLLSGFEGEEMAEGETLSKEEQYELLEKQHQMKLAEIEASKVDNPAYAIAELQAEQSQREAELSAQLQREKIASDEAGLSAQLAQQRAEMNKPYEEAAAERKRAIKGASGLLLTRAESKGQTPAAEESFIPEQTPVYEVPA